MKRVFSFIGILIFLLTLAEGQTVVKVATARGISNGYFERGATYYVDEDGKEWIVYAARNDRTGFSRPTDAKNRALYTLFKIEVETVEKKGGVSFKTVGRQQLFDPALTTKYHDGPASFSADYKTIVFSQQRHLRGSGPAMGLYFRERVDGAWVNDRAFEHNDPDAWLFAPSLSANGKILYFASNYKNGKGGWDIYRSRLKRDGWTEPENMGSPINTRGDEIYPFIHQRSNRLYFSSNFHDNKRDDYDLYRTERVNGEWVAPSKLPKGFNSKQDDYSVWFSEDFSSFFKAGSAGMSTNNIPVPKLTKASPIKRNIYKYRLRDRKLDTVNTDLFHYYWVINDTLEIPGHEIIYEFPEHGEYRLELKVFDVQLDTFVDSQTKDVLKIELHEQAVITTSQDTVRVGTELTFDAGETYLPGVEIGRYIWYFDSEHYELLNAGGPGSKKVTYIFDSPRTYNVKLRVERKTRGRKDILKEEGKDFWTCYKRIVVLPSN